MDFSELTIRVLLVFFPGIVCAILVNAITVHRRRKLSQLFVPAFIYGVLAYVVYGAMQSIISVQMSSTDGLRFPPPSISVFSSLTDGKVVDLFEIGVVTVLAVLLSLAASAVINYKLFNRLAILIRVTKKFGEPDVWGYVFNSPDIHWVAYRDVANGKLYEGWIQAFSDYEDPPSLLLRDVIVYNNETGVELYRTPAVYLARPRKEIVLEFLELPFTSSINRGETRTGENDVEQ